MLQREFVENGKRYMNDGKRIKLIKKQCRVTSCLRQTSNKAGICDKCIEKINRGSKKKTGKRSTRRKTTRRNGYPSALKKAKEAFQKYARRRDADANGYVRCITCNVMYLWNDRLGRMQGGHFIPATHLGTCFMEENVNGQCGGCNKFKMNDPEIIDIYKKNLELKWGKGIVDKIYQKKHFKTKYSVAELKAIEDYYTGKFKIIENE